MPEGSDITWLSKAFVFYTTFWSCGVQVPGWELFTDEVSFIMKMFAEETKSAQPWNTGLRIKKNAGKRFIYPSGSYQAGGTHVFRELA